MSKKIKVYERPVNIEKGRRILNRYANGIPPDIDYTVITDLLSHLGIEYRSCNEGILIESSLHVNIQHKNCRKTVHRRGFAQVLKLAKDRVS